MKVDARPGKRLPPGRRPANVIAAKTFRPARPNHRVSAFLDVEFSEHQHAKLGQCCRIIPLPPTA